MPENTYISFKDLRQATNIPDSIQNLKEKKNFN